MTVDHFPSAARSVAAGVLSALSATFGTHRELAKSTQTLRPA